MPARTAAASSSAISPWWKWTRLSRDQAAGRPSSWREVPRGIGDESTAMKVSTSLRRAQPLAPRSPVSSCTRKHRCTARLGLKPASFSRCHSLTRVRLPPRLSKIQAETRGSCSGPKMLGPRWLAAGTAQVPTLTPRSASSPGDRPVISRVCSQVMPRSPRANRVMGSSGSLVWVEPKLRWAGTSPRSPTSATGPSPSLKGWSPPERCTRRVPSASTAVTTMAISSV